MKFIKTNTLSQKMIITNGYWCFEVFHTNDSEYDGLKKASDGSEYIGEWKDGLPHGKSRCIYVDGSNYDGRWENG